MKLLFTIIKSPLTWRITISLTIFLLLRELKAMHREVLRMNYNQSLLHQEQKQIQLANGRVASQTGVLLLRQQELAGLFPDLRSEIGLLKVRMNSLRSVSTLLFEQQRQISTQLTDSIAWVRRDSSDGQFNHIRFDTIHYKVFTYHDAYYDVSGIAHQGEQLVCISSRDTMTQVVYQKRKRPWLWIFSPRVLEQRVYFKNPDAHISYSQTIHLQK